MRRRKRKDGEARAGSKHISHILEEAPERGEIYERTFAKQCLQSYGARIGRPLGCVQLLHHSAIPQIYFRPSERRGLSYWEKDFTTVSRSYVAILPKLISIRAGIPRVRLGSAIRGMEIRLAPDPCVHALKVSEREAVARVFILLYGANQPYERKHKLHQTPTAWWCLAGYERSDFINLQFFTYTHTILQRRRARTP